MGSLDGLWCMVVGKQEVPSSVTVDGKEVAATSLIFQDTHLMEDMYGNKVATFFTNQSAVDRFDADSLPQGVTIEGMPISCAVNFIVYHIRLGRTTFFSLDPISSDEYRALSAEEFLGELLGKMWESGIAFVQNDSDDGLEYED